jgi:hypothetical protein
MYITSSYILMVYPELKIDGVNVWAGPTTPQVRKRSLLHFHPLKKKNVDLENLILSRLFFFTCISYFNFCKNLPIPHSSYKYYASEP